MAGWQDGGWRFVSELSLFPGRDHLLNLVVYLHSPVISPPVVTHSNLSQFRSHVSLKSHCQYF